MGRGIMALEIQMGGGSEPKTTYIIGSSKSFEKTALRFQILLFFQTTDFLPPLFKFPSTRTALLLV